MSKNFTNLSKNKKGFTLTEVLITLAIVGIVAALAIPSIITNIQNQQYKAAYKQAFADASQALNTAKSNNELIDDTTNANTIANFRTVQKYFNVSKSCTNAISEGCWVDNCINGDHDCYSSLPAEGCQGATAGFIDSSGREWILYKPTNYFVILVDTNGIKTPNLMGRDRFPLNFVDENNATNVKTPIRIMASGDGGPKVVSYCSTGNCYYTSWLTN